MTEQDYRAGQNAVLDELSALLGCSMTTWSCCKKRIEDVKGMLLRAMVYAERDAAMMSDLSRFSPLDTESQQKHDSFQYDSERLVAEAVSMPWLGWEPAYHWARDGQDNSP